MVQKKFLLITIDYFIKWVEVEALAIITSAKVCNFVWKSIICRFDLSWTIIIDNRWRFDNLKFTGFYDGLDISHRLTSVAHSQSNDEAEVTNRTLLQGLKARLGQTKGLWVEELYHELYTYRMTQQVPTKETPFKLAFGTEAVISIEVGLPSTQVEHYDDCTNSDKWWADLDLLDEIRR